MSSSLNQNSPCTTNIPKPPMPPLMEDKLPATPLIRELTKANLRGNNVRMEMDG